MAYFAGLDVSVKETSVCIVDDAGKIVREVKVASEPEALLAVLKKPRRLRSRLVGFVRHAVRQLADDHRAAQSRGE
jgi:predicted NBD/HSP70 family sugar kinase